MSIFRMVAEALTGPLTTKRPEAWGNNTPSNSSPYEYTGPNDDGKGPWMMISNGSDIIGSDKTGNPEGRRIFVRTQLRNAVRFNPHGDAVLHSYTRYAIGRAVKPRWPDTVMKDDKKVKKLDRFWKACCEAWDWGELSTEVGVRFLRDGENFIRRFADVVTVYVDGKPKACRMLLPRFIDPERIRDPDTGSEDLGIVPNGRDIERPAFYKLVKAEDFSQLEATLRAQDVIFKKANADRNERRGFPMFSAIVPYIPMHDRWLIDRMTLNHVRSSVALVRTFDGPGTQIRQALQNENDLARQRGDRAANSRGTDDMKGQTIRPGTVLNVRKGVDYKFINPNLQAADVAHDGRNVRLAISAGAGLAEFMTSADSANANYGQQLASEGPAMKAFFDFQGMLKYIFTKLLCWAVEYEREFGETFDLPDDFDPTSVIWEFARMVTRSRIHETQADSIMVQNGMMSRRTAMARDDLDYDIEQSRMEAEAADFEKIRDTLPGADSGFMDPSKDPGEGGTPGLARNRGPNDKGEDPNDHRSQDPDGSPSNS